MNTVQISDLLTPAQAEQVVQIIKSDCDDSGIVAKLKAYFRSIASDITAKTTKLGIELDLDYFAYATFAVISHKLHSRIHLN